jgi:tetratricopeptide (TPR) repeat protein
VNFSTVRILPCLASLGLAALLLSTASCGDMITYGQDAKREGIRQYNDGRYADAAGDFRNSVRQDPTDPETQYYLGLSYEQTKSYHQAVDAYKTALKLMPPASSPRFNRSVHDGAFDRLARVIANNDPSSSETDLLVKTAGDLKSAEQYRLLGRVFRYRGDADTSLEEYHRSVQLDPDNFAAQKELGLYLAQLGQNQDAAIVLRDAYRLNQDDRQINAALRGIGMEPGPNLMAETPSNTVATPPQQAAESDGSLPASIKTGPEVGISPRD